MLRTVPLFLLSLCCAGAFAQSTDKAPADATLTRTVSQDLAFLKVMVSECQMAEEEHQTLDAVSRLAAGMLSRTSEVSAIDVAAGIKLGITQASSALANRDRDEVCDIVREKLNDAAHMLDDFANGPI